MNSETTPWKITRPCTADWEQMVGDDRKRFCEQCGKHVHNVSAMTRAERAEFAKPVNHHKCVTYLHRPDGAPVDLSAWIKLRQCLPLLRLVRWSAVAALLPAFLTACGGRVSTGRIGSRTGFTAPVFEEKQSSSDIPKPSGEKYETKLPEK
jgi:hypothetical protein